MRAIHRLSAQKVFALIRKPDGKRHADGGGLYLNLKSGGARWEFEFKRSGKKAPATMGLGSAQAVSLAGARALAETARAQRAAGLDPIDERRKAAADAAERPTFGAFAERVIAKKAAELHNAKSAAQWAMTLREYAKPVWEKLAADVTTEDVLAILKPMWGAKPETASRLRGRIEAVLDAATAAGARASANPARWRGHLVHLLPKRKKLSRGHHAALPYRELPAFMAALAGHDAVSARALEFLILTATRSGEVRGARWSEISAVDDAEKATWTIPAERMKARREFRVPLSPAAVAVLKRMRPFKAGDDALIFASAVKGGQMSDMVFAALLDRVKRGDVTAHGFRSSFRDWAANETTTDNIVCEAALAHTIQSKAEAAYRRSDLLDRRRSLMALWADYCAGKHTGNVVPLRAIAAE